MSAIRDGKLRVKHTVTYKAEPLVCFGNLPGYDAELTPQQIRALAAAMLRAAADCEALADRSRKYGPSLHEYALQDAGPSCARLIRSALSAASLALSASHNLTVTDQGTLPHEQREYYVLDHGVELGLINQAISAIGETSALVTPSNSVVVETSLRG